VVGVVRHVQELAGELAGGADVDDRLAQVGQDVVPEGADHAVVALDDRVLDRGRRRHLAGDLPPLGDPLGPPAVQEAHVRVTEQGEHPQGVGRPPVALVAVDDDGRVTADATLAHHLREARAVHVVAGGRVVEVEVPVDLDRAGDVTCVVEQHVLVRLHDDQARFAEVLRQPVGRHETLRVGVGGDLGVVVMR
jgi:hypothetical protein